MKLSDMLFANAMMGEGGGGGSGGDFSTASVTISNDTESLVMVSLPAYDDNYNFAFGQRGLEGGESVDFNTVLYKGKALVIIDSYDLLSVEVTGDIEDDDGDIFVTGDGTITIS
jgi:hypothetical protein